MNEDLNTLQETATTARATADELKAALTAESTDKEQQAAQDAETAAVAAESAYADAATKADTDAGTGEGPEKGEVPDASASRTGFVVNGQPGSECDCPDGRKGTVHRFDEGLICIPNQDQG